MNAAVESAGGSLNGITARDHGCYYTPIHPDEVGTGLAVLGDLIRRPLLKEMDVEREVILEEILDEVDADGRDIDPDNLSKRIVFGDHPLGYKIAGTPEIVRRLSRRDVRAHHQRFYAGSNLVLAVAGPVRASEVEELAEAHLGLLPRGKASTDLAPPPWPGGPRLELVEHDDAQAEFSLSFPCPPERHPDYPVHLCIRRILDDGLSSRLPFEIVERRGLAYSLHAGDRHVRRRGDDGDRRRVRPAKAAEGPRRGPARARRARRGADAGRGAPAGPAPPPHDPRLLARQRGGPGGLVRRGRGALGAGELRGALPASRGASRPRTCAASLRETFRRRNLVAVVVGPSGRRDRAVLSRLVASTTAIPT